jgi:CheY-like chemotaxis protein
MSSQKDSWIEVMLIQPEYCEVLSNCTCQTRLYDAQFSIAIQLSFIPVNPNQKVCIQNSSLYHRLRYHFHTEYTNHIQQMISVQFKLRIPHCYHHAMIQFRKNEEHPRKYYIRHLTLMEESLSKFRVLFLEKRNGSSTQKTYMTHLRFLLDTWNVVSERQVITFRDAEKIALAFSLKFPNSFIVVDEDISIVNRLIASQKESHRLHILLIQGYWSPSPYPNVVILKKPFGPHTVLQALCSIFSTRILKTIISPMKVTYSSSSQSSTSPATSKASRVSSMIAQTENLKPYISPVMIAEDNPINQGILQRFLVRINIECDAAWNGFEAVQHYKSRPCPIILIGHFLSRFDLVDIHMPVMNGIDATRLIRQHEKEKKLGPSIIIALTASGSISQRDSALSAGCNDYLLKPLSLGKWMNF